MSKKLQLSIPKPCHENWDAMTQVEKGRFCGSCQKQVVDFSVMSDRQVAEFFKKPSTGSVCGRFMTDQLERDIEIPKKRIPWLKYFFQFTIPAFLLSLKSSGQKTMGKPSIEVAARDTTKPVCRPMMGAIAIPVQPVEERGIKGQVVDASSGLILPNTSIIMQSSLGRENIKIKSDGSFVINNFRKMTVYSLEFSLPGYETKTISWEDFNTALDAGRHIVKMQREIMLKGEIAINTCRKPFMGDTVVMFSEKSAKDIIGKVVDEKGSPVSYASILSGNPLNFVIADENGEFKVPNKNIPQDKLLNVSCAGFENGQGIISKANEAGEKIIITLKSNTLMPEVVVTSMGQTHVVGLLMGTTVKTTVTPIPIIDNATPEKKNIFVYPNPVPSGTALNIGFSKLEAGYYQLQVLDAGGQSVYQQQIWIDAEARLLTIDLPFLAAGNYFVVMANKKTGKKYSEKIIVQ